MQLRKATRAICGESILELARFSKSSKCLTESTFQGSSRVAEISSSAEEENREDQSGSAARAK
jgi:hypothetical protein